MTTATKTKAPKLFTLRYEITGDPVCDEEPWNIYSPDDEFETCFSDEAEAMAFLSDCNSTLAADTEAEEEAEREELVRSLQAHLEDMDIKALRKLAKRLLD